ncbi:putative ATPase [Hamadaea flava]|uniref:BTAD domain-containing putative transcriptional regulator n=1 Tax=Hamadaea flava TaxID=1742688 RepID=A0ABV8LTN7_9ACTN|nr:BTAD domain-containing putative transcriptional regulator [Hamadaea flava]MCP2328300.1 putative ATPase [Hamadaea flava]
MKIGLLGPFEVRGDDGVVADVPGARLRGLLTALALDPGRVLPKATLVDWIWGENPPADATNALHRLVSRLRKVLPEGSIEGQSDGYRLTVDPDAVDVARFERLLAAARLGSAPFGSSDSAGGNSPDVGRNSADDPRRVRLLREAVALWRGGALQDVDLPDSAAFEAAVTRLERLRLTALEDRYDAEVELGHGADLVTELSDLVAAHPVRERLAGALMRALVASGRDSEALLAYERTREALADSLGVDPSPELSALHVSLLRGEVGRQPERRTNLRAELTSFVGRDEEVAAVRGLVGDHRLTTLIGPGGSGKTRLAMETAQTLLGDLPDGAWVVELATIGPDGDVAQATVAALGLRDALFGQTPGAEATDRAVAALRDRAMLLILDNCEHVIEPVAAFAHRVLGECRRLRILATSREPLGITGESLWPVTPLILPAADADPGEIESAPAVRLLRDRAGAVRQDLAADPARSDPATSQTMARVCRALDGMPLAIELAAARLRSMSLDQLAHRLDDRFRLLTGGSRTALPRHRTLRAVIDWSWGLLSDAERVVLHRLSVFAGGASLEAAEQVCVADGVEAWQVFDLLTALTEKSLVIVEGEQAPRYRMLGTIKEYAGQRLAEAGEAEAARQAHLAYFTDLVEAAEPHLYRAEQLEWLAALEAEHDNIGAAMRGAIAVADAAGAMRMAAAAGWYWWLGGHKAEGNELITAATALPGEVADASRAVVYARAVHAGVHAGRSVRDLATWGPGDQRQADEWVRKAFEISQRVPRDHRALRFVAALERLLHVPAEAAPAFEQLLGDPDPWLRALSRLHLGRLRIMLGDDGPDAEAYLETALAEFRTLGDRWGISFASTELANRIAMRGDFAAACAYYEQAITVVLEVGAGEDVVPLRSRQAQLYWLSGDTEASAAAMAEAQRYAQRVSWPNALAELALAKAELARWSGDAEQAYRQLEIATTMLGDDAKRAFVGSVAHDLLGYLAPELDSAREHRIAAFRTATETGHAPLIAQVLVGVADLALRADQPEQAARLIGASIGVRGLPDRSQPDATRIEQTARNRLGETMFAEAVREGSRTSWSQLAAVTLAS